MTTMRAARTLWEMSGRKASNLSLNKLLYLTHMISLGQYGRPIASKSFEAWDYGPVEPDLYHLLTAYGSSPVENVFGVDPYDVNDAEYEAIADVNRQVGAAKPARLVAIIYWEQGAWARFYTPGARRVITDEAIIEEYKAIAKRNIASRKEIQTEILPICEKY